MIDPGTSLIVALLLISGVLALLWPEQGVLARWYQLLHSTDRVRREDLLKHVHQSTTDGKKPSLDSIAGILQIRRSKVATMVAQMQADGLITLDNGSICLTAPGRETALHIIRAHRLWERHLAEETGFAEETWHKQAERFEHLLSPADTNLLAERLGRPTHDPHGDPIPTASGRIVTHQGQPLTKLALTGAARIVHLEDEPAIVYAQLVAEGLHPGMVVHATESTAEHIRFWSDLGEHLLAPIVAANISVIPLPVEEIVPEKVRHLGDTKIGEVVEVLGLSPRCRGAERRRFMDLGILPGAQIRAEFSSPGGDPTAYRIRDALIALRRTQAGLIYVT